MNGKRWLYAMVTVLSTAAMTGQATHYYVVASNAGSTPPWTNWPTAHTNLAEVVQAAGNDDVVLVSNGTYIVTSQIDIAKRLTVQSANGPANTTVTRDPAYTTRLFALFHTNALLTGFTLSNGFVNGNGGGVYMGRGTLSNCVVVGNVATNSSGGGVYMSNNTTVAYCTIANNSATNVGGGVYMYGNATLRNCLIYGNSLTGTDTNSFSRMGGGVFCAYTNTVESCTIVSNRAIAWGGGISHFNSITKGLVLNCIIDQNYAPAYANWYLHGSAAPTFTNCCTTPLTGLPGTNSIGGPPLFANAAAGDFRLAYSSPCIDAGTNRPWMTGAPDLDTAPRLDPVRQAVDIGAYEYQPMEFYVATNGAAVAPYTNWATAATDIWSAVNAATDGHVVWVSNGTYTVTGQIEIARFLTVQSVNGPAGTVVTRHPSYATRLFALFHPSALLAGFTLTNGFVNGNGGGVYLGRGTLSNCVVAGNVATNLSGGGVYMSNDTTVAFCTIANNSATNVGGGVYMYGNATLRNCLIYGNYVTGTDAGSFSRMGGGVFCAYTNTVESCTIVSNRAVAYGGGISHYNSVTKGPVLNCIIYDNAAPSSANWYLHGTATPTFTNCCTTPPAALPGTNNIVGPPLFRDAPAGNYRLTLLSPCVDAGTNQPWMIGARDLRSYPRIMGLRADIGAYEFEPPPPGISVTIR